MQKSTQVPRGYRFGIFEVDLRAGELRKHGLKIKLQNQPFQVLSMLLENSPKIVLREELRDKLWNADTFVDFDHSLSIAMNKIREALGDSAENARFIETLPRRGYRFVASVEKIHSPIFLADSIPDGNRQTKSDPVPVGPEATATQDVNSKFLSVMEEEASSESADAVSPDSARADAHLEPLETQATQAYDRHRNLWYAALIALLVGAGFIAGLWVKPSAKKPLDYVQITNFTDAATAPAISPDGRIVAFIRGGTSWPSAGQVYIKLLPNGEPVQLTNDPRIKYGLAFSADGSRISYTVTDPARWGWDTVTVSAVGGNPNLLFLNAAGLTWLDAHRVLFSEVKKGMHMGIVRATDTRAELRDVYLPKHERAMAPFSYASPDRKWVVVVEKDQANRWQPCRLVPMDGNSAGWQVGPDGPCNGAAWSPDGAWLYLASAVKGRYHLWRQRFPKGVPEQITFGATEEQGVVVAPDGRSLITSIGTSQSAIWLRTSSGDRPISSEGDASRPTFSADGKFLYYLLRRESAESANELWSTELASGKSQTVLPEFSIDRYDVSNEGKEVVFSTRPANGKPQIWLASLEHRSPPVQVTSSGEDMPFFGPDGQLLFRQSESGRNYLFRMNRDGSGRSKVMPNPINQVQSISPDRRWLTAVVPGEGANTAVVAIQSQGRAMRRICPGICLARWAPDGKLFYFQILDNSEKYRDKAVAIPVPQGGRFLNLPFSGLSSMAEGMAQMGSISLDVSGINLMDLGFTPGPDPTILAYVKKADHRNLFRIPLE